MFKKKKTFCLHNIIGTYYYTCLITPGITFGFEWREIVSKKLKLHDND